VVGYIVPGEVVVGGFGIIVTGVIALLVGFSRNRERIVRLEEWVRLFEQHERDGK
jgi:hypothetical protein